MGLLAALWGASYMFIKIALDDGVRAPSIVFLRIAARRGGARADRAAPRRVPRGLRGRWGWVWAVALAQVAVPFLLITYGERWIPSSLAGILVASTAIFVVLLSPWLAKADVVGGWGAVGVVIGILGVGAAVRRRPVRARRRASSAAGWCCVASVGYAFASIWVREKLGGVQPVAVAAGTMIVAGARHARPGDRRAARAHAVARHVGGADRARRRRHRHRVPPLLHADRRHRRRRAPPSSRTWRPAFSVLYGALFLDEPITAATIGGLALILTGSWLGAEGRAAVAAAVRGRRGPARSAEVAGEPLAEDLVAAGGREPLSRTCTRPFDRARTCARSMKSSRLIDGAQQPRHERRRAFSERRSSRPCLASRPKSTVAAMS